MKKIFSIFLIFTMIWLNVLPTFANGNEKEKVTLSFVDKFNVNQSTVGDSVAFKLNKNTTISGYEIPEGTLFYGKVDKVKHSKGCFIKANALVVINEMVLPNGETIPIKGNVNNIPIKSFWLANIAKGIITTPFTILVGALGGICLILECVTVVCIIFVPQTIGTIGHQLSVTTKGVNKKISKNAKINVHIKMPAEYSQSKNTQYVSE